MIKLFKEVYLVQDSLYDALENKIIFSKDKGGTYPTLTKKLIDGVNYDSETESITSFSAHHDGTIIASEEVFEGCFESFFEFINFLDKQNKKITIYADEESYCQILSTWIKLIFPYCDLESSFNYLSAGCVDDYLEYEQKFFNSDNKPQSKPREITKDVWKKQWNRNYLDIKDEEKDLLEFWKRKNITNLDFPVLLINYLLDGSFSEEMKENISKNIEKAYRHKLFENRFNYLENATNSKFMNNLEQNFLAPSEIFEFANSEKSQIDKNDLSKFTENIDDTIELVHQIENSGIDDELIHRLIVEHNKLIYGEHRDDINTIFIKYILSNKTNYELLEKFKL